MFRVVQKSLGSVVHLIPSVTLFTHLKNMNRVVLSFVLSGMMTSGLLAEKKADSKKGSEELLQARYEMMLDYPIDSAGIPRSYTKDPGIVRGTTSRGWTSGFFPGSLWLIHQLTGEVEYAEKAGQWTELLEREQFNGRDHDMGFRIGSSYGLGYGLTGSDEYKAIIVQSAKTLATRYTDEVGLIRSWGSGGGKGHWKYPVIIDNMMNLELLFEAAKHSGDKQLYAIAVRHADKTLKNHFREDGSTYHVVDYDPESGEVRQKNTHQGLNDSSAWARGQAWAIYGFTLAYRYTDDERYLDQAMETAKFFLEHPRLPEDGVPYWDFDDPNIPDVPKDVSAAAIVCSALYELYGMTNKEYFLDEADLILETLKSGAYILDESLDIPFILDRSTGNYNKRSEVDEPISYSDYYFLEALLRERQLSRN